jgi:signal transduction histidine kinase
MPGFLPLWRSSLRLRLTVAGVSLAAAIFAIGGVVTITLYSRSLTVSVQHVTAQTATAIAKQIKDQWLPDPIPMPTGPTVPRVQVLDKNGSVVTGDPSSAGKPAMYRLPAGLNSQQVTIDGLALIGGSSATAHAVRVETPAGPETVVAAMPLGTVTARVTNAIDVTAGICAGALIVVGAVAWLTAGRVLRPVERMRNRATAITASGDPSGRLPKSGTDELSKLAETLNGMLASIGRSVERQRRFVADAAHELRTPLAGLTAALEIAQQHPDVARDTLIGELLAGHRRLSRTLNDLLVLAALDGRAQKMTPVDLAGVVTDCARRRAPDGVCLCTGALERTVVLGNESQLSRMVGNVVDNALRYTHSKVELSVTVSRRWARVSVTDDGPGIPGPDRERVWDRFVRLDDDRSQANGGSGLGLAIVREIAIAHGGEASVGDAWPGPGAEFVIRLPLRAIPVAKTPRLGGRASGAPRTRACARGHAERDGDPPRPPSLGTGRRGLT